MMSLCRAFKTLPSQIEQEDINVLRLLKLVELGGEDE